MQVQRKDNPLLVDAKQGEIYENLFRIADELTELIYILVY